MEKDVLEIMVYHTSPVRAGKKQLTKEDAAMLVADGLIDHWVWCNVYTLSRNPVITKILKLYAEFTSLVQTRPNKKPEHWRVTKAHPFNSRVSSYLFNILVKDKIRRKKQEEFYGVKMTDVEEKFAVDQINERKMFCEEMVERKWLKMSMRRKKREEGLKRMFENEKQDEQLRK